MAARRGSRSRLSASSGSGTDSDEESTAKKLAAPIGLAVGIAVLLGTGFLFKGQIRGFVDYFIGIVDDLGPLGWVPACIAASRLLQQALLLHASRMSTLRMDFQVQILSRARPGQGLHSERHAQCPGMLRFMGELHLAPAQVALFTCPSKAALDSRAEPLYVHAGMQRMALCTWAWSCWRSQPSPSP